MNPADVEALRTSAALSTQKLQALRAFTKTLLHNCGKASQADLDALFATGYSPQQALEVVLGLAIKTMSNFTNSIAGTPLDGAVTKHTWQKPMIGMRPRKGRRQCGRLPTDHSSTSRSAYFFNTHWVTNGLKSSVCWRN